MTATNDREWTAKYDIEATSLAVTVYLNVQLTPGTGVTQAQIDAIAPAWEVGAERIWSDRFALAVDGRVLPIRLDLSFRAPHYHQTVVVRSGAARVDQLNWSRNGTEQLVAHEVGHMLGAFDEYRGGGNDPAGELLDPISIMSSNPKSGQPYARHYEPFRRWLAKRLGGSAVRVVTMEGDPLAGSTEMSAADEAGLDHRSSAPHAPRSPAIELEPENPLYRTNLERLDKPAATGPAGAARKAPGAANAR